MYSKVWLLCLALAFGGQLLKAENVWIDTDPALGSPFREVDDGYALLLALHSPELHILGISTTYGNAPLARTTVVANTIATRFSSDTAPIRVYPGASSPRSSGHPTAASTAFAEAIRKHGHCTYIALGPLTNLASFFALNPEAVAHIDRIIFVGGQSTPGRIAIGPRKRFRLHDANVWKDPIAAEMVLRAGRPIILTPIESAAALTITVSDWHRLRGEVSGGDYLYRNSRFWLWFWTRLCGFDGGPVFDALAVTRIAAPDLVVTERRFAVVDAERRLMVHRERVRGGIEVQFCVRFQAGAKDFLVRRLAQGKGSVPPPHSRGR
ncbi:MAG: nucleoside hydrolase [Chthoniobacterales bacterium]